MVIPINTGFPNKIPSSNTFQPGQSTQENNQQRQVEQQNPNQVGVTDQINSNNNTESINASQARDTQPSNNNNFERGQSLDILV